MLKMSIQLILISALVACTTDKETIPEQNITADKVLTNGKIYTVEKDQPWVDAVAIKDGKYLFVGTSEGAKSYIGESTEVIDLAGKMAMPGINDAHVHPARGGTKALFECNFAFTATPDEIAKAVTKCVADNPDALWIRGGQWDSGFFDNYKIESPRKFLDAVSGDKAVLLNDDSNHNGWANSKALELGGITKHTKDLADGTYVRNSETGEPNGILLENAEQNLYDLIPKWNDDQTQKGAIKAIQIAHQFGVTGMKDASTSEQTMSAYKSLDQSGNFNIHMAVSISTPYGHRVKQLDYDKIDALREKYKSANVHTSFVKLYIDGVPTASRTAAMLAPYTAEEGKDPISGMLHIEPDLLTADLIELDKRGFTVKVHVAGDRSVRIALDAIEAARKANGNSGLRHELAHAGFIDKDDIIRFSKLQAVADLSPYLWHPSPIIDSIVSAVGPRGKYYWPIKALLDANAPILAGSDWPAAVSSMDPWVGIEAMVSRADPRANFPGTLWPEQAINLEQALEIYTMNGAKALLLDDITGSIRVGKSADLIVLNQDLFDVPVEAINETRVEMTLFKGNIVYQLIDSASLDLL